MTSTIRGIWLFVVVIVVFGAFSCEFEASLTYLEVASHVAILTATHFALVYPHECLDGIGLTLFQLFGVLYDSEQFGFVEYALKRIVFFHVFVSSYPCVISLYFMHGNLFMKSANIHRFPESIDHPWLWLTIFIASVIGNVWYWMRIKDYKQWPVYQYYIDHPDALEEMQAVIKSNDTAKINLSLRTNLYVSRDFFVYSSNWNFVAVKLADVRLQVDQTRMPVIVNDPEEHERLSYIYVKISFRPAYIPSFTLALRQDKYQRLKEEILIFVPPHITIPPTIMEKLIEHFLSRVESNSRHTHRVKQSEKDSCFACGTEDNIIKISKACDGEPRAVLNHAGFHIKPPCEDCTCDPIWCVECIAKIFIAKQKFDNLHRAEYVRGNAACPTCRKNFCIEDVHFVDFDYIAE